jgi:hypothetical protein
MWTARHTLILSILYPPFSILPPNIKNPRLTLRSSGDINYGHSGAFVFDVTLDDTTNSVYLGNYWWHWDGFTGKTTDGGSCNGSIVPFPL